jgi:pimeloyl-ACP methyl ester carboxylesterase
MSSPSMPTPQGPGSVSGAPNDVQTVVIPGSGHWVAEEAPEPLLAALTEFLDPYRDGAAAQQAAAAAH